MTPSRLRHSGIHFLPSLPFVMGSGVIDSDHIIRDERDLLNRYVHHVLGEVTRIDTSNRELLVRYSEGMDEIAGTGGEVEAVYAYDYLVLATGARLVPADLNGLSETESLGQWHHFYSAEGALELRKALQHFEGRRIVITVGGIPYRRPQLHSSSHSCSMNGCASAGSGIVQRFTTSFHYPVSSPIESVAEVVTPLLEERQQNAP